MAITTRKVKRTLKKYVDWLEENEEDMKIYYAESGRDREADFDLEKCLEEDYDAYVNYWTKKGLKVED